MAINIPFGGYGMNPKTGKIERYWGGGTFTQGEDPTGGMGPGWQGDGSQVAQQAIQQATPQAGQPGGGDGDLWSQYQPRVQGASQQSNQLLGDYQSLSAQLPTFQQKLLTAIKQAELYPSNAAMRAEYMQNPDLTPQAIEGLVSKRGQSTRGSIQDIINRGYGGIQADVAQRRGAAEQAQQSRSNLLEEYGFAYQSQQDALDRLKKTGSGTKSALATGALERDVQRGVPFNELVTRYSSLPEWQVREAYNAGPMAAKWGPAKETSGELGKTTDLTAGQTAGIRNDLADDIRGDREGNMSREQSRRENKSLYPELSNSEFENLYNALWPAEEDKTEAEPAIDVKGLIQRLTEPLKKPSGEYRPVWL